MDDKELTSADGRLLAEVMVRIVETMTTTIAVAEALQRLLVEKGILTDKELDLARCRR